MASQYGPATDEPAGPYASTAANGDAYEAERVGTSRAYGTRSAFGGDASIGTLIGDLLRDTNRLVKDEIRLAKAEVSSKVDQAKGGATSIAVGGALALLGLIFVCLSIVYALSLALPGWAAALIVGGVILVIGLVMVKSGQSKLNAHNLAPTRTQENLQRDAQTYKEATK